MQTITVYDIEKEKIEKVAENNDITTAEIVEQLIEYLPEIMEFNGWR